MSSNPVIARLLSANAQWAEAVQGAEPTFFAESSMGQSPKVGTFIAHHEPTI
jgi:carbonic anhydrase